MESDSDKEFWRKVLMSRSRCFEFGQHQTLPTLQITEREHSEKKTDVISSSKDNERNENANPNIENPKDTKGDDDEGDAEDSTTNGKYSQDDDASETDVIEPSEDEKHFFPELDGKPMVCNSCYPKQTFQRKIPYVIHRKRHFAVSHFTCLICREGFLKLIQCVHHELTQHKEETELKDAVFSRAVSLILNSGKRCGKTTENSSDSPKNGLYSKQPVASTSLYPYCGPPVKSYAEAYDIQIKYGRRRQRLWDKKAKPRRRSTRSRSVYSKPEEQTVALGSLPGFWSNEHGKVCSSDENGSESSYKEKTQKRKKFRKTRKMKKQRGK